MAQPETLVTQKANVTAWRGKTVRVTGSLRVNPGARARLWIKVVRPNQNPGPLDYQASESVRSGEWTPREITITVPNDAAAIEYGALSTGSDEVLVRDLSLGVPLGLPVNLDFSDGLDGWTSTDVGVSADGCHLRTVCVSLAASATLTQTFSAEGWRGQSLRLRAMVRSEGAEGARLLLTAETGERHHDWTRVIRDPVWKQVELVRKIDDDADSITIGFTPPKTWNLWVEQVSVQLAEAVKSAPDAADEPVTPGPPAEDQQEIIDRATKRAATHLSGLPDFTCTQTTRRFENEQRGDARTVPCSAASASEFGNLPAEVFRRGSAKLLWNRESTLRDRPVYVFSYAVPLEKSHYEISGHVVAHHGYVSIDKDSGEILRIIRVADIQDEDSGVRSSSTTLDYDFSEVGGRRFLLPSKSETQISTDETETREEIEFRDYRKP